MININLVIRERPQVDWRRVGAMAVAGALLMGFVGYSLIWWQSYASLRAEIAGLEPLELSYRKVVVQSGNLKERADALQKQEEALARIGRNQAPGGQSAVLQAVFGAVSADVSVSDISLGQDQTLLISGQAATAEAAFRYLRALQALPGLTSVEERRLAALPKSVTTFTFAATVKKEAKP